MKTFSVKESFQKLNRGFAYLSKASHLTEAFGGYNGKSTAH